MFVTNRMFSRVCRDTFVGQDRCQPKTKTVKASVNLCSYQRDMSFVVYALTLLLYSLTHRP